MPKLLQINECLNFSTGKIAQQIGESAITKGWESWIAFSSRQDEVPSKSHILKVGGRLNAYIHFLENKLFDREGLSSRCATQNLIKQIEEISPDIVHLHNIHDHYLNYKIMFEYLNKTTIKVVWTFHDCWAFTGHCFHFVTKNCNRWKNVCHDCPLKTEYPKTILDRSRENFLLKKSLFQNCKNLTIVSCSEWMEDFVRESFLKDKKILTIHNGIDLKTFKPSVTKSCDGKFRILAVSGVWNKEKGLYDVFDLRKKLPPEYEITIVGLTLDQMQSLPKGIRGIKKTQNAQELADLYSESDVLINPTYADTFPTVNLEALACGTPVITYKTGGSPEAIDEKTGVVITQGNIDALAHTIISMKNKPLSSSDCRKKAEALFDKNKCFEQYIDLYNDLLNK